MTNDHSHDLFWRHRNVFVSGFSGFLGCWMVKELKNRGATVIGLQRDCQPQSILENEINPDFIVQGSIEDAALMLRVMNEYEIDTVMHLAAQAIVGTANRNPISTFESNIKGTWTLLEACRQSPTVSRIVTASSDKAYGTSDEMPYVETMPMQGRDPYSVSKSCTDLIAKCYHETYGTPVCITRCANFFGGGDLNFSRIVPSVIRSALSNEAPVLRSDGTMIRDYIYVRDVVEGYLDLAEQMERTDIHGEAYNFSQERPLSVLEITNLILQLMGRTDLTPKILGQATSEISVQYLSAAKVREAIDWHPARTLEDGLTETIEWYRDHLSQ